MKKIFFVLSSLLLCATAHAQWKTTTYTLKGGWNAIYLTGDATQDTLDNLLPTTVLEVWRWQPNPTQVGFTQSPLIPSAGTAEWAVWKRGIPAESGLNQLIGQMAYLVKCSGTSTNTYSVSIKQTPQLPANSWVRNGANLLGFPTLKNGSTYPTMSSYFATFPAAVAANTRVYKYVGGELGPANPLQVFSTSSERLDSTQAYWFSAEVTGNYYAPLEISPSNNDGLAFGRDGTVVKLLIRNRSAAAVTLTLTPIASESAPSGQAGIVGAVPLTKRTFNATTFEGTATPISAAYTELVGPSSTVELLFGINRADAMMSAAAPDAVFASLLRITDSGNLMDVYVPVTAQKASLAGLWVGDVSLTNVSNKVSNGAQATATASSGVITSLQLAGAGGFGYTSPPVVTIAPPHANSNTTATAIASVSAAGAVSAITPDATGSGYTSAPSVTLSPPSASARATATASMDNGTVASITQTQAGGFYTTVPTITIEAPPASVTASGSATVNLDKTLSGISLNKGGYYYASAPVVTIDAPALNPATATAVMTGDTVTGIVIKDPGSNYASAPTVTIAAQPSVQASAAAILSATKTVASISGITSGGYYVTAPTVTIAAPPGATNASAGAVTTLEGAVTGIAVGSAGTNYTTAPSVVLSAPPASVTATGTAVLNGKTLGSITPGAGGGYYTVAPTVAVTAPTAAITAVPGAVSVSAGAVTGIALGTAGTNYTTAPTVTIASPPASTAATATAVLSGQTLGNITPISGGGYYTSVPTVTIGSPGYTQSNVVLAVTSTSTGSEILNTGTLVEANHFGNGTQPTITLSNGLTLGGSSARFVPGGTVNSSNTSGVATITNTAFSTLVNSRIWIAYGNSVSQLTIPGLTVGRVYRLQIISTSPNNASVTVEGNPAITWTGTNSVLTATWTAADTDCNVVLTRTGSNGEIFLNGYTLFDVTSLNAATATATVTDGAVTGYSISKAGAGYTTTPLVTVSGGTFATPVRAVATANLSGGAVSGFSVSTAGAGYLTAPTLTVAAPPAAVRALATANLTDGAVSSYTITTAGTNYTATPTVTMSGGSLTTPVQATATSTLSGDGVGSFNISNPGAGYLTAPTVTSITAAPTAVVRATATANVTSGQVSGYTITNPGSNYQAVPAVTISGGSFKTPVQATASSVLNQPTTVAGGTVNSIAVNSLSTVYAAIPTVTVANPPASIPATATGTVLSGVVKTLTLTAGGTNYATVPLVVLSGGTAGTATAALGLTAQSFTFTAGTQTYSAAPVVTISGGGATTPATATAVLSGGGTGAVTGIVLTTAGVGYTSAPSLTISGGTISSAGSLATALGNAKQFTVSQLSLVSGGSGYSAVTVSIGAPAAAETATATALLSGGDYGTITGITMTSTGRGYLSAPPVTISSPDTATVTLLSESVGSFSLRSGGAGYTSPPLVTLSDPPTGVQATAVATIVNGRVTGFNLTHPGSLYSFAPGVAVASPPTPVQATATCVLASGSSGTAAKGVGSTITVTQAGSGYPEAPTITFSDPPDLVTATATAILTNGSVTSYQIETAGSGYAAAPSVTMSAPQFNFQATATATVANGSVTGFTVTSGGGGYETAPLVTIDLPPPQSGSSTPTPFKLRTLLHLSEGGTARLLSEVYLGQLAVAPNNVGLCSSESLLKQDSLASAQCFSSSHLPMDQIITDGSGHFATGQTLTRVINVPYNDATNPFVHAYHPDHDNKDARGKLLDAGVESRTITRTCKFTFTATPPSGSRTTTGWGSSVVGGTYIEIMEGVHKDPLILSGTFELRRASQIGTLTQ